MKLDAEEKTKAELLSDNPHSSTEIKKRAGESAQLRPVKSRVRIHDSTQIEMSFSYDLGDGSKTSFLGKNRHSIAVYIFFPRQMKVSPVNYSLNDFYQDLKTFIRLREPRLSTAELLGTIDDHAKNSPLRLLEMYLDDSKFYDIQTPAWAVEQARVFASAFLRYFYRKNRKQKKHLDLLRSDPLLIEQVCSDGNKYLRLLFRILTKFRSIQLKARNKLEGSNPPHRLIVELDFINEYLSYVIRDGILENLEIVDGLLKRISDDQALRKLETRLKALVRMESVYATKNQIFWLTRHSGIREREKYQMRRSALKRRILSILFLKTKSGRFSKLDKQVGPALAAGLAAIWATFVSITFLKHSSSGSAPLAEALSTTGTLTIVMGGAIAYILKDRIKEVAKRRFERGFFSRRADYRSFISYMGSSGKTKIIGQIEEYLDFLEIGEIDPEICRIHNEQINDKIDPQGVHGDDVICYSKVVQFGHKNRKAIIHPIGAVFDILRFSVSEFLSKLDEPLQKAFVSSRKGDFDMIYLPKVYYIDILISTRTFSGNNSKTPQNHQYVRVILNKKGIARIERRDLSKKMV